MSKLKNYKILFKFATRERPDKFLKVGDNLVLNLKNKEDYLILVSADEDDDTMACKELLHQVKNRLNNGVRMEIYFGTSKNKVDAINRDIDRTEFGWDIVFNVSDDNKFVKKGFDDLIRRAFQEFYPNLDGCLWFNDGFTRDKICTQNIMGRRYYKRFDNIYHPEYRSLFCDMEFTEVAKRLNKISYYKDPICLHVSPFNVGGDIDPLLIRTEREGAEHDEETYNRRKAKNFGI